MNNRTVSGGTKTRLKSRAVPPPLEAILKVEPDARLRTELKEALEEVLTDPVAWLETANPALGGRRPAQIIADGDGELILDRLRAIRYGAFS